jgi:hypothetical protein
LPQRDASLLQLEVAKIFQDDVRHRHTKRHGKILLRHGFLFERVGEKANQALRQVAGVAGLVELDCHSFAIRHLAKIIEIGTNDRHSIGAGQVRYPAASGRRRVGHYGNRRTLEKVGQSLFVNVAGKFNARIALAFLLH